MKRASFVNTSLQTFVLTVLVMFVCLVARAETITRLEIFGEPIPSYNKSILIQDVSSNGSVAVGYIEENGKTEAVMWDKDATTRLGDLPGGEFYSVANAVSTDGSVVVGTATTGSGEEAFRWENGIMTVLGFLPGASWSRANDVSADGSVIVGESENIAFRWENGVMTSLGDLPGGEVDSAAFSVSADGRVIVGRSISDLGSDAFLWKNGQMSRLSEFTFEEFPLQMPPKISADGSSIVGHFRSSNGPEMVLYRNDNTTVLPHQGGFFTQIASISGNGSLVVGNPILWDTPPFGETYLWEEANAWEPHTLQSYLDSKGIHPDGLEILSKLPTHVSDDGTALVGLVKNAAGEIQPYRVRTFEVDHAGRRFHNISSRGMVETGDHVMIASFIIQGNGPKTLLIRGIGPSLASAMNAPVLMDPEITLVNCAAPSVPIAYNDNWRDNDEAAVLATSIPPQFDVESALIAQVQPGAYSAILGGVNDTTGNGLIEVYEMNFENDARIINISTRSMVQTGDGCLIGGFAVTGDKPVRVYIRAIGPSLPDNLDDRLADPILKLFEGQTCTDTCDNWQESDAYNEIVATGIYPENENEPAIVATLEPGLYTVVVTGAGETSGYGLLEVYYYPEE